MIKKKKPEKNSVSSRLDMMQAGVDFFWLWKKNVDYTVDACGVYFYLLSISPWQ